MTTDQKNMATRILAEILECKTPVQDGSKMYNTTDVERYLEEFWDTPAEVRHFVTSWFYRHELMAHHDRESAHIVADALIFWTHNNRMLWDEFRAIPKWYA